MHRDNISRWATTRRGLCSRQFVTDLRAQGLTCEATIEVVSRTFGVTREAARLFVCSHPAWPEEAARLTWVGW
jgi:hypothetical protein